MDKENIMALIESCVEKVANDFLDERKIDCNALKAVYESIRILHYVEKLNKTSEIDNLEVLLGNKYYILENDLMQREVTIRLPKGREEIVLPEKWVYGLIEELNRQIREWK